MSAKSDLRPEDFERASGLMRERSRHLDVVRAAVLREFSGRRALHNFFILDQRDVDFRAYVFFGTNKELSLSNQNGMRMQIVNFVISELGRVGRWKAGVTRLAFEYDSDENVMAKYEGNYYLRLR